MSKFEIGDCVKVYGNFKWRGDCMTYLRGNPGVVVGIVDIDHEIRVRVPEWGTAEVHPKQCRKQKKQKSEREGNV